VNLDIECHVADLYGNIARESERLINFAIRRLHVHQSKYPHYDVAGYSHPGHCNVGGYTQARGIVMSENNNIKELCLIVYNFPNQVFSNKIIFYFLLCKYKEYIKWQNKFHKILGHHAGL
jgi:hypothetical protein